jgi:hypothetical protein
MKIFTALFALFMVACSDRSTPPSDWNAWSIWVEARYPIGDAQGHGPDIGSDEWARALQQKLGIVDDQGHGPDIGSTEWRAAVQTKIGE